MQADGLRAVGKRRFRATTNSNHSLPIAPNVVNRRFETTRPNQIWLTDITYVWTQQGWMYLSCMLDLHSRAIISHELDETLDASVSCRVLRRAITLRNPSNGLVHHSDRGIQYASVAYRSILESHSIVASMSRKGDCWDNAPMESFFATLKREIRADSYVWTTKDEARAAIDEYINYYNQRRLHSQLDYVSPVRYELASAA